MAGRQIKTPGVTESQQPEEQTKTEQAPETGTEQQVSEPVTEKRQRMVLGKDGWTKESY